jgi:hypothetical protein
MPRDATMMRRKAAIAAPVGRRGVGKKLAEQDGTANIITIQRLPASKRLNV